MKTFLKKSLAIAALLGTANIVGIMLVHAQETATLTTTSIIPRSPANLPAIESYSDAQLKQLANALSATPLIWPTNFVANGNMSGTFWSLAHPDWPPLPCAFGTPFWNLTPRSTSFSAMSLSSDSDFDSDSGFYLMDDIDFPPSFGDGSDTNGGGFEPMFQSYTLPPGLKITPPIFTNSNVSVSIYDQDPSIPYDIYYCTNLISPIQWNLVSHGVVGQTNYVFANSFGGSPTVFFITASAADTDGDGLSDGYEALISHTNPFNADTDGDGMSDGWEIAHGLNPLVSNSPYTPPAATVTITKPTNHAVIP